MTDPGYQLKQGSAHQLQDLSLPRVAKSHNPVGRQCRARLNNHSVCQGGICHWLVSHLKIVFVTEEMSASRPPPPHTHTCTILSIMV